MKFSRNFWVILISIFSLVFFLTYFGLIYVPSNVQKESEKYYGEGIPMDEIYHLFDKDIHKYNKWDKKSGAFRFHYQSNFYKSEGHKTLNFDLSFCAARLSQYINMKPPNSRISREWVINAHGKYEKLGDIFPCAKDYSFPNVRFVNSWDDGDLFSKEEEYGYEFYVRVDLDDSLPYDFEECVVRNYEGYRVLSDFNGCTLIMYLSEGIQLFPYLSAPRELFFRGHKNSVGALVINSKVSEKKFHAFSNQHHIIKETIEEGGGCVNEVLVFCDSKFLYVRRPESSSGIVRYRSQLEEIFKSNEPIIADLQQYDKEFGTKFQFAHKYAHLYDESTKNYSNYFDEVFKVNKKKIK